MAGDFNLSEKERLIKSWRESSLEDFRVAGELFGLRHYSHALFYCQLAIEKVLKALFIEANDTYPPPIHNLAIIAKKAGLDLTGKQVEDLNEITSFNVEARYDVVKQRLYKKATSDYTERYLRITSELVNLFLQAKL